MPKLRLDGDAAGAVKAVEAVHKEQAKLVKEGTEIEKKAKALGRELSAAAKRAQTDWQKYNAEVAKYQELAKRGIITQRQADAAAQKYYQTVFKGAIAEKQAAKDALAERHAAYKAAEAEKKQKESAIAASIRLHNIRKSELLALENREKKIKSNADAEKKSLAVAKELAAEQAKMASAAKQLAQSGETATERYKRKMLELGKAFRSGAIDQATFVKGARVLKDELKSSESQIDRTFGTLAIGRLAAMGASIFGVTQLVGQLNQAFQDAEQKAQAAADAALGSLGTQGELQQLHDDPEKLKSINDYAKSLVARGVFTPDAGGRSQAFKMAFELESAQYSPAEKEAMARLGETGMVAPEGLVELGGNVRKAQRIFEQEDFGTTLDKFLYTAAKAQASLSEVGRAIPEFGSQAMARGLNIDEALAGYMVVEKRAPGPEEAATRYKNFLGQMDQKQLGVMGDLTDSLDTIKSQMDKGEQDFKLVPEIRALAGLRALMQGRGEIAGLESGSAASEGMVDKQSGLLGEVDPSFRAGKLRQRAGGALADTQSKLLIDERENLFATLVDRIEARNLREGRGTIDKYIQGWGLRRIDEYGGEEDRLRGELEIYNTNPQNSPLTREDAAAIRDYLRRSAEALETMKNKKPPAVGRQK